MVTSVAIIFARYFTSLEISFSSFLFQIMKFQHILCYLFLMTIVFLFIRTYQTLDFAQNTLKAIEMWLRVTEQFVLIGKILIGVVFATWMR